ncbi:MAG: WYL domain-containing protein, partial [Bacteroidota bacterium]
RESVSSAIEKIKAILRTAQKGNVDLLASRVIFGEQNYADVSSNNLMPLQAAIIHFQVLTITYHSVQQQKTTRDIEPFAIYSTGGKFMLIAYCRMRQDFRAFRIDLIKKILPTGKTFPVHNMTMQRYFDEYIKA